MKLKYVCSLFGDYGLNIAADEYVEEGVPLVRTSDFDDFGRLRLCEAKCVPGDAVKSKMLRKGDILFSRAGTIGRSTTFDLESEATFAAYLVRFRPNPLQVEARYVQWWAQSQPYWDQVHAETIESTIGNFNAAKLSNLRLPALKVETQKAVADFLDREIARIDQLTEKKLSFITGLWEREDSFTRRLLSGELSEANGRIATSTPWLQSVPKHWTIIPLRHLVTISTGGRDTQDRTDDGEYPFYVRSMSVERIDTYSYDEEAVLTSGDGAGVGKVFHHVFGKFELHQRMYAFTEFQRLSGRYFFHFLKTFFHLQMTQWSAKSTVDSVRMPFLKSMLFAVPPAEEQQELLRRIDTSLSRTERIVDATEKSIDRLREFRAALITAAVTGQIDVTAWGRQGQTDRRLDEIQEAMSA